MTVNFTKLLGLLRRFATDKQGVTRSQPQIHDSRANARPPNSGSFGAMHYLMRWAINTHACSRVDNKEQCEPHQLH